MAERSSWLRARLGDVLPLEYGRALPAKQRRHGAVPVVSSSGITGTHDEALVEDAAVVVGRKGNVGAVYYLEGPSWPIDTVFYTMGGPGIDLKYAYYMLMVLDLSRLSRDSAVPGLNRSEYSRINVVLPSMAQQRAIAEVLGALDDKIMKNAALIEKAESLAVALAAQASSVIPVRKLAAQRRETVVPQGLTDPLVQHFSLPAFDQARVPEAVDPGSIKSAKFRLSAPAVLISKLNPRFPRVWNVAAMPASPALASTEFVVLEPNTVTTTVLWALLSQPNVARALQSMVAGTSGSHQRVKPEAILATEIGDPSTLPPGVPEQITAVGERAEAARAENLALQAARDALLPGLMSGKLRVRDAERVAEEVA